MDIECSNTPLEIVYGKPELDTPLLSLKGTGNGHVNMICNDNTLKATGAISDYKIQAIDVNGNLMYNQTVTVSAAEKDVIDSSQESMMADESSREPADELIS